MADETIPAPRRGPWDPPEGSKPVVVEGAPVREAPRQPLIWAIASTLLLAGFIAWRADWRIAVAGVVGVFVHEYGHVLAINALGCGPGRIHIVPFLGGAAHMSRHPSSDFRGVLISLAGPAFGLLAAIPFFLLGYYTGETAWTGGAIFIAVINLVNLLPAPPLDGSKALGPALHRVHPMLEKAALVAVGVAAVGWGVMSGSYIFAGFVALGVFGALRTAGFRAPARVLSGREWISSVLLYSAAVCACLFVLQTGLDQAGGAGSLMRLLGAK
jgi:Zn-dependent protease